MKTWTWNLVVAVGAALLALAALLFLHGELRLAQAAIAGLIGAGLRWWLGPSWSGLPAYLSVPLDLGIAFVGALAAALATLGLSSLEWSLLRLPEALALAAATALGGTLVLSAVWSHKRLAAEISDQQTHLAALRERALQARLGSLQAQINPHFLFNTLNTLSEVVHEDADLAEDLITDLAGMMRYALASTSGEVALSQELDTVRRYLRLEGARLGDRLVAEVQVEPGLEQARVPGLLIQPLVENAICHAVSSRPEGGRVRVSVRGDESELVVEVCDDGPGLPDEVLARLEAGESTPGHGTGGAGGGLLSVRERLTLTWPSATFEVDPEHTPGTLIRLRMPR